MQLQIEYAHALLAQQSCLICHQFFQPSLARVIVCSNDGETHGDICAECLARGSNFIQANLQQVVQANQGVAQSSVSV